MNQLRSPKSLGYYFPAEWHPHQSTWLSFPHNENSFPGKLDSIYPSYFQFIKTLTQGELVNINIVDENMRLDVIKLCEKNQVDQDKIKIHFFPNNDAWTRDHGPAFLINPENKENPKIVVKWEYNAWGDKYPPYDLDNLIPSKIAEELLLPFFEAGIVMEGGSLDFNGKGTVITTTSCLLNPNRNPTLSKEEIEVKLKEFYGVETIIWLGDGIIGDDTDGHVDDITRFVNEDTIITMIEHNKNDENYLPLIENLKLLQTQTNFNIIELPMPSPVIYQEQRLPASYANFYIANSAVIVPTFKCKEDDKAMQILEQCFKDRKVIGIDSTDIIWGLGSFHCLSQQEPKT